MCSFVFLSFFAVKLHGAAAAKQFSNYLWRPGISRQNLRDDKICQLCRTRTHPFLFRPEYFLRGVQCGRDVAGCAANLAGLSPAELPGLLAGAAHGHQRFENFRHVGRLGALEMALHPAKIVEMLGVTADFLA
jgi:hypothetical protein